MNNEALKEGAKRILNDQLIQRAFSQIKQDALEELAIVDAADINAVLRLQSLFLAVDEVQGKLDTMTMLPDDE